MKLNLNYWKNYITYAVVFLPAAANPKCLLFYFLIFTFMKVQSA